ncbi:hypothetical protein NUACC26_091600 [Scytonema sp. NUACC26]
MLLANSGSGSSPRPSLHPSPRSQAEPGNAYLGGGASCNDLQREAEPAVLHSQPEAGNEKLQSIK